VAPAPRSPSSAARIVYAGIVASTSIITVGALTTSLVLGTATAAAGLPDGLALVAGAAAFLAGIRSRKRLRPSGSGDTGDQWWNENGGRVLLIWGLMELTAVTGAVVVFATGHLTAFAALAVLGLAGLASLSPRRVL
jgi:hypothetical protein